MAAAGLSNASTARRKWPWGAAPAVAAGVLGVGLTQRFNYSGQPQPTIAEPKPDPDVETLNPSPTTAQPTEQPTDQTGESPDVVNKPPENPSWLPEQKWPTIPTPPIKTELERKLISNWLYQYYVPIPRGCPTIDPKQNQTQYKANAQALVDCLYNAWEPIFADSLNKPKLHFYKKTVETPCNTIGKGYWTFYCPRNETIYISEAEMTNPDTRYRPYATMFHEFIHHVQASAGIFDAMDWNGDKRAEHIRRLQLQGQCLEARQLILTDVVDFKIADYDEFVKEQLTGIDKTLGKPKTAVYWGVLGFYVQRIDECNTWAAPSDSVK